MPLFGGQGDDRCEDSESGHRRPVSEPSSHDESSRLNHIFDAVACRRSVR